MSGYGHASSLLKVTCVHTACTSSYNVRDEPVCCVCSHIRLLKIAFRSLRKDEGKHGRIFDMDEGIPIS